MSLKEIMRDSAKTLSHKEPETSCIKRVVIVSGSGGEAFNSSNIMNLQANLQKQGAEVHLIGDGENSINYSDIESSFTQIAQDHEGENVTTIVMAHGWIDNGEHVIGLEKDNETSTRQFISMIANSGLARTDFVFTSCYGGHALMGGKIDLSENSNVASLGPERETTAGADIDRWIESIADFEGSFNAQELLYLYLTQGLQNRLAPCISNCGLDGPFADKVGQCFSNEERARVNARLESVLSAGEIERGIELIETAKSEWSVGAKDYGLALAIANAARDDDTSSYSRKTARRDVGRGGFSVLDM